MPGSHVLSARHYVQGAEHVLGAASVRQFEAAAQFNLKFFDAFLILPGLFPINLGLRLLRRHCAQKPLPSRGYLLGIQAFATTVFAQFNLGQAGTLGDCSEFHLHRLTLGRVFGGGHHYGSFGTGLPTSGVQRHFRNALGHRQIEWREQHLEEFGFALRGIVRHNGSVCAPVSGFR